MVAKNQSPVYKPITCPSTNTEQPRGYLFALALSIVQYSPIHRWWSFVKDRIGPSLLDSFDLWGSSWVLLTIRVQFRSVHIAFVKVSSRYFTVCSFEILWAIVTIDWKSFEKFDRIVLNLRSSSSFVAREKITRTIFDFWRESLSREEDSPFSCERIERNFRRSFSNDKQQRRALAEEAFPKEGAYIWP